MQNLGQSDPYNFFYSLPALNLRQKVFTKSHDSTFKNTKFSSFWGRYSLGSRREAFLSQNIMTYMCSFTFNPAFHQNSKVFSYNFGPPSDWLVLPLIYCWPTRLGKLLIRLRGYCTPGPYFWRLCAFSQKIKQLRTKHPMDLVRNVPRNSKITILLQ